MKFPHITVAGETVPAARQVSITVDIVEQFTEESPAQLQIQFKNEAQTPREFLFGPNAPFGPLSGESPNTNRLHVIPFPSESASIPPEPINGCWKLTDHYFRFDRGVLWQAEPGVTLSETYVLLDDPDNENCLDPGTYRFEAELGESHANTANERFKWDFEISLK